MFITQFLTTADFIADLDNGDVISVYHQLIEQRVAATEYGTSQWQLTTVIRALVANPLPSGKAIARVSSITFRHGETATQIGGRVAFIGGRIADEGDDEARWRNAREQHDVIVEEFRQRLAEIGLTNVIRAGVLNVEKDLPLVLAAHPLDELAEALLRPNGGNGSAD